MPSHPFLRYDLRTTDPEAARRFYASVLGLDLDGHPDTLAVWMLHENARARGAPAHWLGSIRVDDVEAARTRLLGLGSEPLGPVLRAQDGSSYAAVKDPLGSVMAVREGAASATPSLVAWHQLHTTDVDRAVAIYGELFGWATNETVPMPDLEGGHRLFAWEPGGETVGSMGNTARWPGVHPHWLFYFPVADLDAAVAKARAEGGKALDPIALPNGDRVAPCDDPQGAAFGLLQRA